MNKEKTITITLEEYKELLIIKGKYEELKNNQPIPYNYPGNITWTDENGKKITYPYKITCGIYNGENNV